MNEELDEWLNQTGVLALKALAGDLSEFHGAPKGTVKKFILSDPAARERAIQSMRIDKARLPRDERGLVKDECRCRLPAHTHGDVGCVAPARGM